jgi:hypothetical protein
MAAGQLEELIDISTDTIGKSIWEIFQMLFYYLIEKNIRTYFHIEKNIFI